MINLPTLKNVLIASVERKLKPCKVCGCRGRVEEGKLDFNTKWRAAIVCDNHHYARTENFSIDSPKDAANAYKHFNSRLRYLVEVWNSLDDEEYTNIVKNASTRKDI